MCSGPGSLNCIHFNSRQGNLIYSDENERKVIGFVELKVKQSQGNLSEKLFYAKSSYQCFITFFQQGCKIVSKVKSNVWIYYVNKCFDLTQSAFAWSKLIIETLEQGVKYVQS